MRISFTLLPLIAFLVMSCSPKKNQIVFDEAANQNILYGFATTEIFSDPQFSSWYSNEYSTYLPNNSFVDSLGHLLDDVSITIILGTWCKDSRREVPRFIKLINSLNFPLNKLTIIGVNRTKESPEAGVPKGFVEYVPTFIVYRAGNEIGRIIESPNESLEKDLYLIIKE